MNIDDTKEDLIDYMRESRKSANSVFIKFTDAYKEYPSYTFCFYEGEDGKYYNTRIEKYFKYLYLPYSVGNKKEVLKLLHKIESDKLYENTSKLFFVDKDFDESIRDLSDDLYETPCYSIENLYTTKECLERILIGEFGLNVTHPDYQKCVEDFLNKFDSFTENMLEFNSLILLRRKLSNANSDFKFGSVKTTHLFTSSILAIEKSPRYSDTISKIISCLSLTPDDIQTCKEELSSLGDYSRWFRGKNQLDCFISILKSLVDLNKNEKYFSEKLDCVNLNITKNRLSELSQYATTPPCLESFLYKHAIKIESN